MITIPVQVAATTETIPVSVSAAGAAFALSVNAITEVMADPYTGSYEFTPSSEAQTIPVAGLGMTQDLVINPIPSDYGHIGWNGSVITVS